MDGRKDQRAGRIIIYSKSLSNMHWSWQEACLRVSWYKSKVFNIYLSLEHLGLPSLIQFICLPSWSFPPDRLKEGSTIIPDQKIFWAISQVLRQLLPDGKRRHTRCIPYRESAVTMLMSNVLRSISPQLVVLGTDGGDTERTLRLLKQVRGCLLVADEKTNGEEQE